MPEHANVDPSNIHEPKGANSASVNTTYISDGAGSGSWSLVPAASITGVNNINIKALNVTFDNISTAGSRWLVCPLAGDITKIYTVIDASISGADCGISFEIGGVAVTNGNITIAQSGSAAGDVDSSTPTAANTLTAGQAIEIISDGASSNTCNAHLTFIIDVS